MALVAWCLGAGVFFRAQAASAFDHMIGDGGDARLIVLLHEHWVNVLRGHEPWRDPGFFHPVTNVLGHSDTFLINQVFYLPLRLVGLDPFLSFQLALVALNLVGYTAFYVVCRRHLGVPQWIAIPCAIIFCFANNLSFKANHPQVYNSYWLAVVLLLVLEASRPGNRRLSTAAAVAAGALFSLVLYSTYYPAWTAILILLVVTVVSVVVGRGEFLRSAVAQVRSHGIELAAAAAGALVGAVPFALTYLPILRAKGGRSYDEALAYSPRLREVVDISSKNYLWGSALERLAGIAPARIDNSEFALAPTPVLLAAVLGLAACFVVSRRRGSGTRLTVVLAVATVVLLLLPLSFRGHSPWRAVWILVPGAVGIRSINRIQIVTGQMAALALAVGATALWAMCRQVRERRTIGAGILLVIALVVFEQLNLAKTALVDVSNEMARLDGVPAPPAACRSFAIADSSPAERPSYEYQIDAMLIAATVHLPTVNGYSGQVVDGWELQEVRDPGYEAKVRGWAAAKDLRGVCSYDEATRLWSTLVP